MIMILSPGAYPLVVGGVIVGTAAVLVLALVPLTYTLGYYLGKYLIAPIVLPFQVSHSLDKYHTT